MAAGRSFRLDPETRDGHIADSASDAPVTTELDLPTRVGPLLYLRGTEADAVKLSVLLVIPESEVPPLLETDSGESVRGDLIHRQAGRQFISYAFGLPMRAGSGYILEGARYPVHTDFSGDLRVAFVSCNGQEHADRDRPLEVRNALWQRLRDQHEADPFQVLLQGGDQIYADEVLEAHPRLLAWRDAEPSQKAPGGTEPTGPVVAALRESFLERYLDLLAQPQIAWILARLPALAMWDDHDICDGWGSLKSAKLDAPVGRAVFSVAREYFLLFQFGTAPDAVPDICHDPGGASLSWDVHLPGLHLVGPDLRSERRPERVMGTRGWAALENALSELDEGRVLLVSSVPALGPRLSWVEAVMHLTRRMEKYEDDLRDQWQSRAHRAEWQIFLERLADVHADPRTPLTVISGEIHLATRGTLAVPPEPLQQLVASGISHPAPPIAYARTLGALARLGESPLKGRPIRLYPLPGQSAVYAAQRNYLVIERRAGAWRAIWELEDTGSTPALPL